MPVHKDLLSFQFEEAPHVPKRRILDIFQGEYIQQKRNVIFIGNSGTGKSHLSIALGKRRLIKAILSNIIQYRPPIE
ncbi:ATP-binding protein [Heyndrickxia sporothermodurans]|uniref:ATP-binding protein n=1 Tax=Heyndrickxia sporothermodurans TaxID=46224 RepID=UPI0036D29DA8